MKPIKPPKLKRKLHNFTPVYFPIFDVHGQAYTENNWPVYHGIFKEKVVLIKDKHTMHILSNSGYFGQYGKFDNNEFIDYRTLQNQVLKQNKNWHAMTLIPFKFPNNNEDNTVVNNEVTSCQSLGESSTVNKTTNEYYVQKIESFRQKHQLSEEKICIFNQKYNAKDNIGGPVNWRDLKKNHNKELEKLLILSGFDDELPFYLLLEEAFFLCYTIECLHIHNENDSGVVMSALECWKKFNSIKINFSHFYAAYHYYRSRGWVVKPGHQYSGDYVLYKCSPIFYHSSFVVVINVNEQNNKLLSSWQSLFGCSRTIEATNKDLIVCTVHGPEYEEGAPIDLTKYTVTDTIVRRWLPTRNREK